MLAISTAAPLLVAFGDSLPFDVSPIVAPLFTIWGIAYVIPFYLPAGEYAMTIGGSKYTAMYTNMFDAAGFIASALWNPWATSSSKGGDFKQMLLSQAAFAAISAVMMPLGMARVNAKAAAEKKKQ